MVKHILPLKHDHFIGLQVGELQLASLLDDVRVLPHQEPADVGEEESPQGVMGVRVCLREFMVDSVISSPLINIILCKGGTKGK